MAAETGAAPCVVAGRYEIDVELARGGMGVVFRVIDHSTGRILALKRSLDVMPSSAALFEREYRTLVSLRHPRIVEVYDFGLDEDGPFYTMELLDGADLRARSPLDWREVCSNLREVASSLALLHSRRLLHRDVSAGNIRLTSEGRAKLIDFGTLTSFGNCPLVAGTPPGVAPEALGGVDLDQRLDLFALGATAYYSLTGRHAYPARNLRDLGAIWARGTPSPPSKLVAGIPNELDELVLSLLSLDRTLRPSSDAEVIDRLGAIAGLSPERDDRIAQSYLVSQELVGRERQFARLRSRLKRALSGLGSALLVEAPAGHGRTALLCRFESEARIEGAAVLAVSARTHQRPFGTCHALLQRALNEVPNRAKDLAKIHFAGDEPLDPEASRYPPSAPSEFAPREQSSDTGETFERFFTALSTTGPLVILVDDVHLADGHSLPVLAALAKAAAAHPLLIVTAVDSDDPGRNRAVVKLLGRSSGRIRLRPFDLTQVEQLIRATFSEASSTKRVAAWLHRQAGGNPLLSAELVTHLVKQGRIHYAEGTWVLPHEFPDEDVHAVMTSAVQGQLDRLRPALRRFAECLSPHRRSLNADLCDALRTADPELVALDVGRLLEGLVREGVLLSDDGEYVFARARVREVLYANVEDDLRCRLHEIAAKKLAARANGIPERELEVGRHLLLAGDRAAARDRIRACMLGVASQPDALVRAVPELRDLYREYQRIGGSEDELLQIMAPLVVSGYYVDPTVHDDFGSPTAELLQQRAGFAFAGRLAPWVGSYPAMSAGLLWGAVQHVWSTRSLRVAEFSQTVLSFVGVCAARSAVGYLRFEPQTHQLLLQLLSPAKGLHRHNAVRLVHDLIAIAVAESKGAFADVYDGYEDQLARLPHVLLLAEEARHHYEAGLWCSFGRCRLFRIGSGPLECADRVTAMGGEHDRVLAQFLRYSYHLYRGETEKAEKAEEVVDAMAAQYGHRWVPDVLAVWDFVPYHLSGDVVGLKRVLHRTERILALAPAFAVHRDVIRAMYEGHRGRTEVALAIYEGHAVRLAPFSHPLWSFAQAHRAECLNALGRHEEALKTCQDALRYVGANARVYVVAYQQLEREAAIALAGLGRTKEAAERLDDLIAFHEHDSHPLLLGLLNRDRARVAKMADDRLAFEQFSRRACAEFSLTGNPTLLSQAHRLAQLAAAPDGFQTARTEKDDRTACVESLAGDSLDELAQRALEHIVSRSGATRGYLYLLQNGKPILSARHGDPEAPPALESAVERLLAPYSGEYDASTTSTAEPREPSALILLPLVVVKNGRNHPVGAAAVFQCATPGGLSLRDLEDVAVALRAAAITVHDREHHRRGRHSN